MIQSIKVYPLVYNEPHYRGMARCVTIVRIEDKSGAVGWGEAISQFREATIATKVLIDDGFAPLLLRRSADNVEQLWRTMCRHAYWYGVEGIAAFAISALDMALWDLKGKLLNQPVAKLLGGQVRDKVPAMGSIIFDMDDLDWTLSEFRSFRENGYLITKAGWGMRADRVFGQDAKQDFKYISEVRKVIGDDIALVVDIPGARGIWDCTTAIRRLREWEEFDLRWVEQPLPPHDLDGYARLRASVATPIGAGEDEWGPESYGHVIRSKGVDVLQIDPGRCLGLTGCREIVRMVESAGLKCSAHSWSGALNTAASLHFLATSPACDTLDFKPHPSPMQHDVVHDPWEQKAGYLHLRDAPGLGVSIDEGALDAFVIR